MSAGAATAPDWANWFRWLRWGAGRVDLDDVGVRERWPIRARATGELGKGRRWRGGLAFSELALPLRDEFIELGFGLWDAHDFGGVHFDYSDSARARRSRMVRRR